MGGCPAESNEMQKTVNSGITDLTITHPMTEQTHCVCLLFAGQSVCTQSCAGHRNYKRHSPFLQEPKTAFFSWTASYLALLLKDSLCKSVCLWQLTQ